MGTFAVQGNLGDQRNSEQSRGLPRDFKSKGPAYRNPLTKFSKPRIMRRDEVGAGADPKGPDTMGGVIGGTFDLKDYSGVKAGTKTRRR